jgi:hypothetical protein
MLGFQLMFLHISKDVAYDANNNVLNSMYQMPTTTTQGK